MPTKFGITEENEIKITDENKIIDNIHSKLETS